MSWDTPFPEPIPVPGGDVLLSLRDAGVLIQRLPTAEALKPAWQNAMQALMQGR